MQIGRLRLVTISVQALSCRDEHPLGEGLTIGLGDDVADSQPATGSPFSQVLLFARDAVRCGLVQPGPDLVPNQGLPWGSDL
jgi:hypothetical protein